MKTVSTATLKARLVHYLEAASIEPIIIEAKEGPIAALVSYEEYARLVRLDRDYWQKCAQQAEKAGYLGIEKSAELLKAGLHGQS